MNTGLVLTLLCLSFTPSLQEDFWYKPKPCPSGIKVNEDWFEPKCVKCTCASQGHVCFSCKTYRIVPSKPGCTTSFDSTKQYPGCCEPIFNC